MTDVVLIQTPCWGNNTPPLGLASLATYLRQKGYLTMALDLNIDMFFSAKDEYKKYWEGPEMEFWRNGSLVEEFFSDHQELIQGYLDKIASSGAKLVGFSVYDTATYFSVFLAQKIRENSPEKLIVFGGPHCSPFMCRDFFISQPCIDAVVVGEGEETLVQIADMAVRRGRLDVCPGALVKINGQIIEGPERPLIANLDELPFPDFTDYPLSRYIRPKVLPSSTSRGCINHCIFCNEWPYWRKFRFKSGERLFQEIKHQLSLFPQIKVIEFHDSLCNGNLKELSVFADRVIAEGMDIKWGGQAVIHGGMDWELINKLKLSGCHCLAFGMESGSQSVLQRIKKNCNICDAQRIVRQLHEAGIAVVLNFMFGHPGETEEDFRETLDFVAANKDYLYSVNPSPSLCGIAPGTYLFNHPEEFEIVSPIDNGLFWRSKDNSNNYPVRLERFERFCQLVADLGIGTTYPYTQLVCRHKILGDYYYYLRDFGQALNHYRISLEKEGRNNKILALIEDCQKLLKQSALSA